MPVRHSNFTQDIETGRVGEQVVTDWFRSLRSVASVRDVSGDPDWQAQGVDLIVRVSNEGRHKGGEFLVDVKSDNYLDVNQTLSWELVSSLTRSTPGWGLTTQAGWIAFYAPESMRLFLFETDRMRRYIANRPALHWNAIVCQNAYAWSKEGDCHSSLCLKIDSSVVKEIGGKVVDLSAFAGSRQREKVAA